MRQIHCVQFVCEFTGGLRPYHSVLIIDLHHNDWRVVSQLAGLPEQLHVIKHQQLVPRGAKRLAQDLQTCALVELIAWLMRMNTRSDESTEHPPQWPGCARRRRPGRRGPKGHCCQRRTDCEPGTCALSAGTPASLQDTCWNTKMLVTRWEQLRANRKPLKSPLYVLMVKWW